MDICALKKQADDEAIYEKKIEEIQNQAISQFEKFLEIMERSHSMWNEKMKVSVDTFVSDFIQKFQQDGFSVKRGTELSDLPDGSMVKATYKNLEFTLLDINYDNMPMYFSNCYRRTTETDNIQEINEKFWIGIPINFPDYFCSKDSINIKNKRLCDYVRSDYGIKECYKDYIHQFDTEDELKELLDKININIKHFEESIANIDAIDLCIRRFGTEETYHNFEEFINAIE